MSKPVAFEQQPVPSGGCIQPLEAGLRALLVQGRGRLEDIKRDLVEAVRREAAHEERSLKGRHADHLGDGHSMDRARFCREEDLAPNAARLEPREVVVHLEDDDRLHVSVRCGSTRRGGT